MRTLSLNHIRRIFTEVKLERIRQNDLWGEQNHPSITPGLTSRAGHEAAEYYEIPTEDDAKQMCEDAANTGGLSYTHIAVEELCEAVEAKDDTDRREELVQLAAVVVAWIEAIDRRKILFRVEPEGEA